MTTDNDQIDKLARETPFARDEVAAAARGDQPPGLKATPTWRPISPGAEALIGVKQQCLDHGYVELIDYMEVRAVGKFIENFMLECAATWRARRRRSSTRRDHAETYTDLKGRELDEAVGKLLKLHAAAVAEDVS